LFHLFQQAGGAIVTDAQVALHQRNRGAAVFQHHLHGLVVHRVGFAAALAARAGAVSSGSFRFARPGKFIWTYQKPYEQVLQADGDTLYVYDKDLNQVTTRKLGNALGSSPAAILFGSNDLEKNFTLAEAGARDGLEWLTATPKAKDTSFESIGIGLKDGTPQAMELKDNFGQTVLLKFTSFQRNPALGAQTFRFEVPKGAEVVNQ
jgi:outer membrane lipoprotein carrier protein